MQTTAVATFAEPPAEVCFLLLQSCSTLRDSLALATVNRWWESHLDSDATWEAVAAACAHGFMLHLDPRQRKRAGSWRAVCESFHAQRSTFDEPAETAAATAKV